MDSQAVEKKLGLDSSCWKPWPTNMAPVPHSHGVYLFRISGGSAIPRVKGTSDIVYVGSGMIRDRLRCHCRQDWKKWSGTGWIILLILRTKGLDVAWLEMSKERAASIEAEILQEFLVDHFELPPANRKKPVISHLIGARLAGHSLTAEERARLLKGYRGPVDRQSDAN